MCSIDEAVLHRYVDEDLSEPELWILNAHLEQCADCRRTLNQLKILDWDLRHRAQETVPDLSALRDKVLTEQMPTGTSPMTATDYYQLQSDVWERSTSFIQHIPPVALLQKAGRQLVEHASLSVRRSMKQQWKSFSTQPLRGKAKTASK